MAESSHRRRGNKEVDNSKKFDSASSEEEEEFMSLNRSPQRVSTADNSSDFEYAHSDLSTPTPNPPISHTTLHVEPNVEVPPQLTWTQKVTFVIIGVFVFCSTPMWSVPFALKEGGWLGFLFFIFCGIVTYFTALLIPLCVKKDYNLNSYSALGFVAFGIKGRYVFTIFACVFSYATCIDAVMVIKDNLQVFLPESASILTALFVLIMALIVCYRTLDEFIPLWPGIGVLLTVIVIFCLAYEGVKATGFSGKGMSLFKTSTLHMAVGFYAFCFCGHPYMPMVYTVVRNRTLYWKLLLVIFLISTLFYGITGILGYCMYGAEVKPVFTLSMQTKSVATQVAICSTVFNHMIRYVLNITPLSLAIDGVLPGNLRNQTSRNLIRLGLALLTMIAIFGTPHYASIVSLLGSVVGVTVSLLIPSLFFIRIRNAITCLQGSFCWFVIVAGSLALVLTLGRSIIYLLQSLPK